MKKLIPILLTGIIFGCSKPQKSPFLSFSSDVATIETVQLKKEKLTIKSERMEEEPTWLFRTDSLEYGIYQLLINDQAPITLLIESGMPTSIYQKNNELSIRGNDATRALWKAQKMVGDLTIEITKTGQIFPDSLPSGAFSDSLQAYKTIVLERISQVKTELMATLEQENSPLLAMHLLQLKAGNHSLFDPMIDSTLIMTTAARLKRLPVIQASAKRFIIQADSTQKRNRYLSPGLPGKSMPVIQLPNVWGDTISTQRFIGQKPTLFVIWDPQNEVSINVLKETTVWSRPYRSRGMNVVLIAVNCDKASWQTAMNSTNTPFWHLAELDTPVSTVFPKLGIPSLPHILLTDSKGTIVATGNNYASIDMEAQLIMEN